MCHKKTPPGEQTKKSPAQGNQPGSYRCTTNEGVDILPYMSAIGQGLKDINTRSISWNTVMTGYKKRSSGPVEICMGNSLQAGLLSLRLVIHRVSYNEVVVAVK